MGFSDILADAVKGIPLAEVLRERLALAEQQFTALDRDFAKLKLEKEHLESENRELRTKLQQRAAQIHALEVAAHQESSDDRPKPQPEILLLLMAHGKLSEAEISRHLGIGAQPTQFALARLEQDKLVRGALQPWGSKDPVKYSLSTEGQSYLNDRGLLQ